eukprot:6648848-Pyramimonas_sp.AAC.1
MLKKLHELEGGLLRRVGRYRKLDTEKWEDYMKRATKHARKVYRALGCKSVVELVLERVHRLAGQICCCSSSPPRSAIPGDSPNIAQLWVRS